MKLTSRLAAPPNIGEMPDSQDVAADISKQLRLLDKVVRYRFGDNAELMGAWESARNVAGSFQTKNEPESGAGGSETLREAQGRPPKAA